MPWRVALHAFGHEGELCGRGIGLVARFPLGGWEPVDRLARGGLVERRAGIDDPVGQAVAAEACKAHQLDVLRIVPVAQMPDKAAERGSGHFIGQFVKRIGRWCFSIGPCIRIHSVRPWVLQVGRP